MVKWLHSIGVQFNTCGYDELDLRNFGGQKKKRTAFAKSDTGKQIMTAMIDAVRRLEVQGQIERFEHHSFRTLLMTANICHGCVVCDNYTGEIKMLYADAVIVASGGMHGLFGNTTGSLANTGEVSASLFSAGVPMANLEMIQYHPTTVEIGGKKMADQRSCQRRRWSPFHIQGWKPMVFYGRKISGTWQSDAKRHHCKRNMENK